MGKNRTLIGPVFFLFFFVFTFSTQDVVYSKTVESGKTEIFVPMGHTDKINTVNFSPDGQYILSGSSDKTLKIWEIGSGNLIRTFEGGHTIAVTSSAFSHDGRYIASGGYGTLKIWDVSTGNEIKGFKRPIGQIESVGFSLEDKYVLAGGDVKVILLDVSTGKEIRSFSVGKSGTGTFFLQSAVFSPDGNYILAASKNTTTLASKSILWEVKTGKEIKKFEVGRTTENNYGAFSPDGKYITTVGKLWDMGTGEEVRSLEGRVTFSPNSKNVLLEVDGKIKLLDDIISGREIRTFSVPSGVVIAFSPDGKYAVSKIDKTTFKLWDMTSGKEVRTFKGHSQRILSIASSSDSRYLLSSTNDNNLEFWDIVIGQKVRTFKGHFKKVNSVAFSPDNKYAVSGSDDRTLKYWEVTTGKEIRTFKGHSSPVTSVDYSPDGRYIVSSSNEGRERGYIKLWDVNTGRVAKSLERTEYLAYSDSLIFSPNGREIVSGIRHGGTKIALWDVRSGRYGGGKPAEKLFTVRALDYSPNSRYIAYGGNAKHARIDSTAGIITLMDADRGNDIREFIGHTHPVTSVSFSPDSRYAVSGSLDNTIRLWDINTGRELRMLEGHSASVYSVAISNNGRFVISGSGDGSVRLWNMQTGDEIARFISFSDGEWVVITPEGYFNASKNGAKHVNVRVGNKVFSIDQFYSQFYRPEIVQLALAGQKLPSKKTFTDIAHNNPAPFIDILSPRAGSVFEKDSLELVLKVTDNGGGIGNINIYLNGSQVSNETRAIKIKAKASQNKKVFSFDIPLNFGQNEITVIAFNKDGSMESRPAKINVISKLTLQKPNLHAIVIGINEYKNKSISLKYAVSDAQIFSESLKYSTKPLFENIYVKLLTTLEETSKEKIKDAFKEVSKTVKPNDLFVFYDASHGLIDIVDDKEQYYLITSNVLLLSSRRINKDALSQTELIRLVGSIPAQKKLIILDTCHAGKGGKEITLALLAGTRGLTESTAIKLLQRAVGSNVFSASSDTQAALEGYQGHGLFTYALVKGLTGAADIDGDGFIKIYELADYVEEQVVILSEEKFKRQQTPIIQTGANFPLGKKVERAE